MMKAIKQLKRLLLLLCLMVAGSDAMWATTYTYVGEYPDDNGNRYYVYSYVSSFGLTSGMTCYTASLKAINATGDVVIPKYLPSSSHSAQVSAVGWWYDHEQAEDITCTTSMTSLTFEGALTVYGNFTLSNLNGTLTFNGGTLKSDATLNIPNVTTLTMKGGVLYGYQV
ncbi:MAG: hypothetical protein IJ197_06945 [Bacteroidaceae bacterium]|nr:hypothetical protein [Bacteroidaceae bacterium]